MPDCLGCIAALTSHLTPICLSMNENYFFDSRTLLTLVCPDINHDSSCTSWSGPKKAHEPSIAENYTGIDQWQVRQISYSFWVRTKVHKWDPNHMLCTFVGVQFWATTSHNEPCPGSLKSPVLYIQQLLSRIQITALESSSQTCGQFRGDDTWTDHVWSHNIIFIAILSVTDSRNQSQSPQALYLSHRVPHCSDTQQ